jgi:hypothetical protein
MQKINKYNLSLPEVRFKLAQQSIGKSHSQETRAKLFKINTGKNYLKKQNKRFLIV